MKDMSVQHGFFCHKCEWHNVGLIPLWRPLPAQLTCPNCGAAAEASTVVGADHPSLGASERARLRWLLNEKFEEPR
jgi:hypothetical protein